MFDTRLRHDAKAKGRWFTDKGGSYTAIGVGGSATGRGFKIGIIDDPFKNREEADSATIRDSRHKWYQSTFYTRAEGASMIILILTRWHEDDLAGRVLADAEDARKRGDPYDEWDVVEFKAIATQEDEHRKVGDPLWPAKFSLDQLQRIKSSIGSYEFSALYQQTPIDEENRKFKQAWFQYRAYEDVRQRQTYNTMTIDPRGKDDVKLGKDYIGVTINLCDAEGNWNIISERIKLSATGMIDMMFTNWARYKLRCIGVEDTQFWQGLKNQVDQEMKLRGVFPRIEELKTRGTQKELRIETLVPRYEHGNIYHLTIGGQNMCGDLEEELALFPKATNDDASDSLAYQDQVARKPMQEVGETFTSNNVGEYFL
jgi:phage terminase large subunit-like protein